MVRFLVLYDKPQDVGSCDRHYREVHIPLTKKLPGLRRYAIGRNPAPIRGGEAYYLIAELDWDDMAALQQAFQSPEGPATARDVPKLAGNRVRSMVYELLEV
ncbi:MAG TPA: EthD family reductase [Candidatus Dormibacteraeota bacterium]|nr:EthD family reductase [Candidatus Dormibacteraeota bacterium]